MQVINKKTILVFGILAALLLIGSIVYISTKDSSPNIDQEVEGRITTSTRENNAIKSAVLASLGEKGYPDKYTYDRPVTVTESENYNEGWVTARVEILDEPPESGYRYMVYILRNENNAYTAVASSQFEAAGVALPGNIPSEVMNDFWGSHE